MNAPMPSCLTTLQETIFSIPGVGANPTDKIILADEPDSNLVPSGKSDALDTDILQEISKVRGIRGEEILAAYRTIETTGREVTLEEWNQWQEQNGWPEGHVGSIRGHRTVVVFNAPRGYGVKVVGKRGRSSRFFVNTFITNTSK